VRERLVAALVGLTVLVVALYGVPRAYLLADLVRTAEQARVERTAEVVSVLLDQRLEAGQPVTDAELDTLAASGEQIAFRDATGASVTSAAPAGIDEPGSVSGSHDLAGGGEVTVTRTAAAVSDGISGAVLTLVVQGLLLIAFAALVGIVLARRLARPLQGLADAARGLGEGRRPDPALADHRVPEVRTVGRALVEAGQQIDLLISNEREVAVRASHELRTPVTALRLELEDLALWPETTPSVAAELDRCVHELDRLSLAIDDLVTLSETRHRAMAIDLDLDALVGDVAARLDSSSAPVTHRRGEVAPTRLEPQLVAQLVEALVQHARSCGADQVELSVAPHHGHYEVRVVGSGDLVPDRAAPSAWASISELAAASGGQISQEGATLVLRLPRNEVGGAVSGDQTGLHPEA
jgi:signal transduction histidine kinase